MALAKFDGDHRSHSRLQEENVVKVVGATSSEGFLVVVVVVVVEAYNKQVHSVHLQLTHRSLKLPALTTLSEVAG